MRGVINVDDVVSAIYARLAQDADFRGMVHTIDKGARRREGHRNPASTVHMLTGPIDAETDALRGTVLINTYANDTSSGRVDYEFLGKVNERVVYLIRRAHLPSHAAGALLHPRLLFKQVHVSEVLILPSDQPGEHLGSVSVHVVVKRK